MNPWERRPFVRDSLAGRQSGQGVLASDPGSDSFVREAAAQWEGTDGGSIELDEDSVAVHFVPTPESTEHVPPGTDGSRRPSEAPAPKFQRAKAPRMGEEFAGFRILAVLGHGAEGFVYLATQRDLADRPVVLKVSSLEGAEHRSLARLQHTHIVPILSAQDLPEIGMRILCLPYMGGTTLERILDDLANKPPRERSGRDVLDLLDHHASTWPLTLEAKGPARDFLSVESYERVVAWIGLCLADALHHAHHRSLVHWDVKPANILLASDGLPLLLDFHLAQPPFDANGAIPRRLGGTPPYLAPEQFEALVAVTEHRRPPQVDARADIYALAMVLHVALAGKPPAGEVRIAARLRLANPRVSPGLAAMIECGLANDPRSRYASAELFADDLRRHLENEPLKGVANPSLSERWGKWRKHHPVALARVGALSMAFAAIVVAVVVAWSAANRRLIDAIGELEQSEIQLAAGDHRRAALRLDHGLNLLNSATGLDRLVPGSRKTRQLLFAAGERNRKAQVALALHELVERSRFLDAAGVSSTAAAPRLEARLAEIWAERDQIRRELFSEADDSGMSRVRTDMLDLAIHWANLRVELAGDGSARSQAHRQALATLASARADWGPSPVLTEEARYHAEALGRREPPPPRQADPEPSTAWDFSALGRALMRRGDLDRAAVALDQAVAIQPDNLWSQFHRGQCSLRRLRYDEAVDAFGACVALAPRAVCYYNRALAYAGLGSTERARLDLERAWQLDPELPVVPQRFNAPLPPR